MTLRGGGYDGDPQRIRAGLVVLLAGVALLLAALGMAVLRGPQPPEERVVGQGRIQSPDEHQLLPARLGAALIVLGLVLVATLLVASYALFRHTRRYSGGGDAKPSQPTPSDDIW
ncbi:MAG: hypothetical protein ACYSVY_18830, partial [Planctomycetota bacterium]